MPSWRAKALLQEGQGGFVGSGVVERRMAAIREFLAFFVMEMLGI